MASAGTQRRSLWIGAIPLLFLSAAARADQGVTTVTVEKVQANATAAQAELPPAPGEQSAAAPKPGDQGDLPPPPLPNQSLFGSGLDAPPGSSNALGNSGRDVREPPPESGNCPDGMIPVMQDGQQVLDLDGKPMCKIHHPFIKGELTNLGATKLKVKDSRFGIGARLRAPRRLELPARRARPRSLLRQVLLRLGAPAQHPRLRRRLRRRRRPPLPPQRLLQRQRLCAKSSASSPMATKRTTSI